MKTPTSLLAIALLFCQQSYIHTTDHPSELSAEYVLLGDHFQEIGRREKAMELYKKALSLHTNNPLALVKLATINCAQKNIDEAITQFNRAINLNYENADLHFNLGLCYQQQEDWKNAAQHFKRACDLDHAHLHAHLYAAAAYEKLQDFLPALVAVKRATQINTESFEAWHQLGSIYRHIERLEDAIEPYRKAMELQPNNLHVIMDLANALNMLNQHEEALKLYQTIVEKNPNAISALYNFGFTLKKMDKLDRALEIYKEVLAKKPDYAPVHFSLSSIYLSLGDFENGLPEYEWRWKAYNQDSHKKDIPLWEGQDLTGRTLLVCTEQGLGDTIQFVRYLKLLKAQNPSVKLIIETQSALAHLLRLQPYIDHVISRHEQRPRCDYQIPLMSIPHRVQTRLATIPADIPYIAASEERLAFWKEKLSHDTNFKIGICWQGNARYSTQALRRAVAAKSLPLQTFKPLSEIPGVSLYSLQQIDGIDQITTCDFKDKLILFDQDFDAAHGSFMDTAAVIPQLDLIISVDTATCHLAAAMGTPTWIIVPFPADWRWLRNRSDSPWYPSVRLFRQHTLGNWDTPINEIVSELQKTLSMTSSEHTISLLPHQPTAEQHQFFEHLMQTLN